MEAIEIRKWANKTMNLEGAYMLSHTRSAVLEERLDSRRRDRPVKSDRSADLTDVTLPLGDEDGRISLKHVKA